MEDMDEKIIAVTGKLSPYGSRNLDIDRAIFRAGIREVVEWLKKNSVRHEVGAYGGFSVDRIIPDDEWQAKLKDWGIDEA